MPRTPAPHPVSTRHGGGPPSSSLLLVPLLLCGSSFSPSHCLLFVFSLPSSLFPSCLLPFFFPPLIFSLSEPRLPPSSAPTPAAPHTLLCVGVGLPTICEPTGWPETWGRAPTCSRQQTQVQSTWLPPRWPSYSRPRPRGDPWGRRLGCLKRLSARQEQLLASWLGRGGRCGAPGTSEWAPGPDRAGSMGT